jgi:hypothetical protein
LVYFFQFWYHEPRKIWQTLTLRPTFFSGDDEEKKLQKLSIANIDSLPQLLPRQGDQIGRIFAHWGIVYFGIFKTHIFGPFLNKNRSKPSNFDQTRNGMRFGRLFF